MLKNPAEYGRDTTSEQVMTISHQASLALLLGVSTGVCKRDLVDESGMIRTQIGMHNRSLMPAVLGTPFAILPHNSNGT
jgi:hypothetical protein